MKAEPTRRKSNGSCAQRRHRPGLRDVRAARRGAAAADQRHRSADADLARGLLHGPGPPRLPGRPVRQPRHRALNAPDRRSRSRLAHRDASSVRRAVPAGGHGRRRPGGDGRARLARRSRRGRLPGRDDRAGARHPASRPGTHAHLNHVHGLRPHRDHAHAGGDAGPGAGGRHPGHQPGSGQGPGGRAQEDHRIARLSADEETVRDIGRPVLPAPPRRRTGRPAPARRRHRLREQEKRTSRPAYPRAGHPRRPGPGDPAEGRPGHRPRHPWRQAHHLPRHGPRPARGPVAVHRGRDLRPDRRASTCHAAGRTQPTRA